MLSRLCGDHPETDPAPHSVIAAVSAPIEAVTTFADTDATFASRTPTLAGAKPSLLLLAPAVSAFGGTIGYAHPLHAFGFRRGLVLAGIEPGIGGQQARHTSQLGLMRLESWNQQLRVTRPLGVDFVVHDNLILGFLQLDQLAELGGLTGLTFADHLGRWLEDADDLAFGAGVTMKNPRSGLAHHLPNQR